MWKWTFSPRRFPILLNNEGIHLQFLKCEFRLWIVNFKFTNLWNWNSQNVNFKFTKCHLLICRWTPSMLLILWGNVTGAENGPTEPAHVDMPLVRRSVFSFPGAYTHIVSRLSLTCSWRAHNAPFPCIRNHYSKSHRIKNISNPHIFCSNYWS